MSSPTFSHIIWDWNGTLLDDAWLCVEVMNTLLVERNLPPMSPQKYMDVFNFPVTNYYRKLGFDFDKESFEVTGTAFITKYNARSNACSLRVGAKSFIQKLHAAGIKQSILSASQHDTLVQEMHSRKLTPYLDTILGIHDHYATGKLQQGLALLEVLPCQPDDILLIGDTTHDYEISKAMGIHCWLIASGHHSLEKLNACDVPVFTQINDFPFNLP